MEHPQAIDMFAALAHPTRLAVFRLLVGAGPDGLPALEIGRRLDVVASTLSGHLGILKRSGVLTATRHAREIHYAANLSAMNDLVGFLLADCCGGKLENCVDSNNLLSWPEDAQS
ncbi:ArsR/SmtB family transcription factor [Thalassococcus lentus]|uniref:Metalloregulator ArsR/SmtB family transcription factor n=1 Tax=Thalassococcus lentus TaxID=1210524 RepID=A0ABT4XR70_9RHOB|nr:metalloregulator ArsR/SmtB family transcription factor [Thalassococcus lentus]MDA7424397.1 metalloregulator ArsR/SmtB family transcription factor [Thalassococcus lentus]